MTETLPETPTVTAVPVVVETVPCVYCREPIAADAFTYWSAARRLLSAACPACQRQVTIAVATWQRWSRGLGVSAATP